MGEVGMLHVETHDPVGEMEREELRTYGLNSKSMSKIAKAVLKLTALMGLEPVAVSAQETLLILACAWAGTCLVVFQYRRKLEKRLYWNEFQQAEG